MRMEGSVAFQGFYPSSCRTAAGTMRLSIHDGNLEYRYFIFNTITEITVIPVSAWCSAQNLGIPGRHGAPMAACSIPRTLLPLAGWHGSGFALFRFCPNLSRLWHNLAFCPSILVRLSDSYPPKITDWRKSSLEPPRSRSTWSPLI